MNPCLPVAVLEYAAKNSNDKIRRVVEVTWGHFGKVQWRPGCIMHRGSETHSFRNDSWQAGSIPSRT